METCNPSCYDPLNFDRREMAAVIDFGDIADFLRYLVSSPILDIVVEVDKDTSLKYVRSEKMPVLFSCQTSRTALKTSESLRSVTAIPKT